MDSKLLDSIEALRRGRRVYEDVLRDAVRSDDSPDRSKVDLLPGSSESQRVRGSTMLSPTIRKLQLKYNYTPQSHKKMHEAVVTGDGGDLFPTTSSFHTTTSNSFPSSTRTGVERSPVIATSTPMSGSKDSPLHSSVKETLSDLLIQERDAVRHWKQEATKEKHLREQLEADMTWEIERLRHDKEVLEGRLRDCDNEKRGLEGQVDDLEKQLERSRKEWRREKDERRREIEEREEEISIREQDIRKALKTYGTQGGTCFLLVMDAFLLTYSFMLSFHCRSFITCVICSINSSTSFQLQG